MGHPGNTRRSHRGEPNWRKTAMKKMGPKHSGDDLAVPWRKPEDDAKMDGRTF